MKNMNSEMHDIFHQYLEYYAQRDSKGLKTILSSYISGIGTGKDENTLGDLSFIDLYERDFSQIPNDLIFTIHKEDYHVLSTDCFVALAVFDLTAEIQNMTQTLENLRVSCVFQKSKQDNNAWKLKHKHISSPLLIQEMGESAPIKELQRQKKELERQVELKTEKLISINKTLLQKNVELEKALEEVKTLEGLIPICSNCKKFRDDAGYWQSIEEYFDKHTDVKFTHSICDECMLKLYPDFVD